MTNHVPMFPWLPMRPSYGDRDDEEWFEVLLSIEELRFIIKRIEDAGPTEHTQKLLDKIRNASPFLELQ